MLWRFVSCLLTVSFQQILSSRFAGGVTEKIQKNNLYIFYFSLALAGYENLFHTQQKPSPPKTIFRDKEMIYAL